MEKHQNLKADIRNQAKAKANRSQENSEKNFLSQEEKKAQKIFYEKSKILQVSRMSVPFKI